MGAMHLTHICYIYFFICYRLITRRIRRHLYMLYVCDPSPTASVWLIFSVIFLWFLRAMWRSTKTPAKRPNASPKIGTPNKL